MSFFARDVDHVAKDLLGSLLFVGQGDARVGGTVIETEAYSQDDPASHSFKGQTDRNLSMFGPPGHIYVYRIYGIHLCLNVVTGPVGQGSAVLIRSLEPVDGIDVMRVRRRKSALTDLCSGPAKLCQALGVESTDDGRALGNRIVIAWGETHPPARIATTKRIGVTKGAERERRFVLSVGRDG